MSCNDSAAQLVAIQCGYGLARIIEPVNLISPIDMQGIAALLCTTSGLVRPRDPSAGQQRPEARGRRNWLDIDRWAGPLFAQARR